MTRKIAAIALAIGMSATPAMARPHSTSLACTKLAEIAYQGAVERDRGFTEQDELNSGVRDGLNPDAQFYFRWMTKYVFEDHADDPPSRVESSFYNDCMDANNNE